jgi:peptidyl-prolyl cis-trans isomerase C
MKRFSATSVFGLFLASSTTIGLGQTQPTSQPTTTQSAAIAATVNGHPIPADSVEDLVRQRTPKEILEREQAGTVLAQQRVRYLDMLVENELLDEQAQAAGIKITDADMAEAMESELQGYLSNAGLTRDEFDTQLRSQRRMSLEQFLAERIADPFFRGGLARKRLIEQRAPEALRVTDDEIKELYEKHRDRRLTKPEQVRVSHILVATEKMDPQQKAEARTRIERILAQVREPGADFAALATRESDCPSKAKGGDLGFSPRRGGLAEPLAAAAFSLQVGQISDVVESPLGYHILKVTDKAGPRTMSLEEARLGLLQTLREQKSRAETKRYADELRAKAQIVYAPGWSPPAATPMPAIPASQPAPAPPPK